MARVAVIIPTFDHGVLLRPAIRSVLGQTVTDLEIHVMGDGAPPETDTLMDAIAASEPRVHYHRHAKSPRTGEAYRDQLLRRIDAEVICYLCDDDLWMPDHVEVLAGALDDHDLAATETILLGRGEPELCRVDLATPEDRAMLLGAVNRVGLSVAGHRLDSYLRLPHGWRSTPAGEWTDHWMWKQWLEQPWVRAVSIPRWTAVHIPQVYRTGWSNEDREAENLTWLGRISSPDWPRERDATLLRAALLVARRTEREREVWEASARREAARAEAAEEQLLARSAELAAVTRELDGARRELERLRGIESSTFWRASAPLRRGLDLLRQGVGRS